MSEPRPITAIITWAANEQPDVPSAHRYRGTINMPDGTIWADQPIDRPGCEVWEPDQLVKPLRIGARIHGDLIGDHCQWDYTEKPVVGDCEDLPGGGGGTPAASGMPAPVGDSPTVVPMRLRMGRSDPALQIALMSSVDSLIALGNAIDAARRARA